MTLARASVVRAWIRFDLRLLAQDLVTYLAALLGAFVVIGILLLLVGANPLAAFGAILSSALGTPGGIGQTLNRATPLILGALAVAFAQRAGLLNVGVDGQIYLGAIVATGVGLLLGRDTSPLVGVPLLLLASALGGVLAMLPAALLRAYWGVSEIFVTVMLNFILAYLAEYLATGPWNDPRAGEAISRPIANGARLLVPMPELGAHLGILIALALAAVLAWVLRRTLLGYSIRAIGDNPRAARVGGVAVGSVTLVALLVSGAVAGLAGGIEVSGYYYRLILGISPGFGYMAILLAVLGRQRPVGVVLAASAFAVLLVGSDSLQRSVRLPQSAVLVFQAIILLAVLLATAVRDREGPFRRRSRV